MKFSKFIVLLSAALAVFAAAVSCNKEKASASVPESAGKVELCITGDFNDFDTKSSITNVFRMTWNEGDIVYVYGKESEPSGQSGEYEFSYLGTLTATPDSETDNRVADLTGTITAPKENTKLTLVHSPILTSSGAPEVEDGAISIDLSSQSGKASDVTFVAYTAVDYKNDESATYRTSFSFATSVLRVNVTGLSASTALTNATLGAIETKCKLTFRDSDVPTVSGVNSGTITRTFTECSANTQGAAAFYFAVPSISANVDRKLVIDQSGNKTYQSAQSAGFATGEKGAGNMMNSIAPVNQITDLNLVSTANSYIVSTSGTYKFKTVKGNSSTSVGTVSTASVLWESYGTSTAPSVGALINADVSYVGDKIIFSTGSQFPTKKGNAVIAAKDASGNILWSWHIWLTDKPSDQVYNNSAGTMMDRNLGATSAGKGQVGALGLIYQWGRKDPFLNANGINSSTQASSTINSWPAAVDASTAKGSNNNTLAYSIANPTTFIKNGSEPYDWYCTSSSDKNDNLWNSTKTIYDPCPVGYRVPDGGTNMATTPYAVWSKAFGSSGAWQTPTNWDNTNKGMDFGSTDRKLGSGTIWYPAAGYRDRNSLSITDVGSQANYLSCTPSGSLMYILGFSSNGVSPASTHNTFSRASANSVRCLKE